MKKKDHDSDNKLHFVLVWVLPLRRRWRLNHDKESLSAPSQNGAKNMPEDRESEEETQLGKDKKDSD